MSDLMSFQQESVLNIQQMAHDDDLRKLTDLWLKATARHRYVYNWSWLGLPIIQFPTDIVATQELIWKARPTVIVETGIARGGSLSFSASLLAMLDLCQSEPLSGRTHRSCIGIDIDIRTHNREQLEKHALAKYITLIEGSSIDVNVARAVGDLIHPSDVVLVILDSHHSHDHVAEELSLYSSFVTPNSYLIVHDTGVEFAEAEVSANREWGHGNNPHTAVTEFLSRNPEFEAESATNSKLLITSSPGGYLMRRTVAERSE